MKDLTISNIERQNVLNNRFAVSKVQEHLDIEGILFEGEYRFCLLYTSPSPRDCS